MKINFAEVEVKDNDFPLLPDGQYLVNVTDGEMREANDKEFVNWEFTIAEGDKEGQKVWDRNFLTPDAMWRLKLLLGATGFEVEGELDFEIDAVVGKQLYVTTKQKAAPNGKTYVNITRFKALGDDEQGSLLP